MPQLNTEAQLSWLEYLLDMQGVADSSSAVSTNKKRTFVKQKFSFCLSKLFLQALLQILSKLQFVWNFYGPCPNPQVFSKNLFGFFATFLKKGSAKNFHRENFLWIYTASSTIVSRKKVRLNILFCDNVTIASLLREVAFSQENDGRSFLCFEILNP